MTFMFNISNDKKVDKDLSVALNLYFFQTFCLFGKIVAIGVFIKTCLLTNARDRLRYARWPRNGRKVF